MTPKQKTYYILTATEINAMCEARYGFNPEINLWPNVNRTTVSFETVNDDLLKWMNNKAMGGIDYGSLGSILAGLAEDGDIPQGDYLIIYI